MAISLSAVLKRNLQTATEAAKASSTPTVGVFVGATSGIGENTAYAFAKYTPKPVVYIVGRNADAGARVLSKLKSINDQVEAKFLKHDMTLIREADKCSQEIMDNEQKVNVLFLSPGFLTLNGRTETDEGVDSKMSVNFYGRWRVVQNLLPLVQKAAELDENARVVSVLAPGNEGPVNLDDLDLKHNYSLTNANRHFTEFNSLAVERFAKLYPNIGFLHAGPGIVRTGITREFPWYVRYPLYLTLIFASKPEDSAERFYYIAAGSPDYRTGSHILDGGLKSLKERAQERGYLTPELQETVWKHTEQLFKDALAKGSSTTNPTS